MYSHVATLTLPSTTLIGTESIKVVSMGERLEMLRDHLAGRSIICLRMCVKTESVTKRGARNRRQGRISGVRLVVVVVIPELLGPDGRLVECVTSKLSTRDVTAKEICLGKSRFLPCEICLLQVP